MANRGAFGDGILQSFQGIDGHATRPQVFQGYTGCAAQTSMPGSVVFRPLDIRDRAVQGQQAGASAIAKALPARHGDIACDGCMNRCGADAVCIQESGDIVVRCLADQGWSRACQRGSRQERCSRCRQALGHQRESPRQGLNRRCFGETRRRGTGFHGDISQGARRQMGERGQALSRGFVAIGQAGAHQQSAYSRQRDGSGRAGACRRAQRQGDCPISDAIGEQISLEPVFAVEKGRQIHMDGRPGNDRTRVEDQAWRTEAPDGAGDSGPKIAGSDSVAGLFETPRFVVNHRLTEGARNVKYGRTDLDSIRNQGR